MFGRKATRRVRLAEIIVGSQQSELDKKTYQKLVQSGAKIKVKGADYFEPGNWNEEWKGKTNEERHAEGERLLKEYLDKGLIPIYSFTIVVDINFFIDTFPNLMFEYKGPVYTKIFSKR